jgi:hypothetical protein
VGFEFPVDPTDALEAFHHPYAYAANVDDYLPLAALSIAAEGKEDAMTHTLTTRFAAGAHLEYPVDSQKPCGHVGHFGWCPACQRAQLARWDAQLAEASRIARKR